MDHLTGLLVTHIPNAISILSCCWFFFCYWQTPVRTMGLNMILTLALSDFLFHSLIIGAFWATTSAQITVLTFLFNMMIRFSLFWASNISFFLHRMLSLNKIAYLRGHFRWSLVILLLVSAALGLVVLEKTSRTFIIVIVTMVIPLAMSTCITMILYYRSKFISQRSLSITLQNSIKAVRSLYWFSFAQFATLCPIIIYDLVLCFTQTDSPIILAAVNFLVGLTGLGNALIYYIHRRGSVFAAETEASHTNKSSSASNLSMRNQLIVEYGA